MTLWTTSSKSRYQRARTHSSKPIIATTWTLSWASQRWCSPPQRCSAARASGKRRPQGLSSWKKLSINTQSNQSNNVWILLSNTWAELKELFKSVDHIAFRCAVLKLMEQWSLDALMCLYCQYAAKGWCQVGMHGEQQMDLQIRLSAAFCF